MSWPEVKLLALDPADMSVVARHDAPIRHLFSVKDMSNMLVTGGWDKTLRYWDLRQPNPAHVQQLPERVYAMDVRYPLAVVTDEIATPACCATSWMLTRGCELA